MTGLSLLAAAGGSDGVGLGVIIVAVGVLMAGAAYITLRGIWGRSQPVDEPLPRQGPLPTASGQLRSPAVGEMRRGFRLLISFDFGCLALLSLLLLFIGLAVIFRSL